MNSLGWITYVVWRRSVCLCANERCTCKSFWSVFSFVWNDCVTSIVWIFLGYTEPTWYCGRTFVCVCEWLAFEALEKVLCSCCTFTCSLCVAAAVCTHRVPWIHDQQPINHNANAKVFVSDANVYGFSCTIPTYTLLLYSDFTSRVNKPEHFFVFFLFSLYLFYGKYEYFCCFSSKSELCDMLSADTEYTH